MQVVVGRIVRPHGVRGEAVVEPRTDRPAERFAPGEVLTGRGRSLTVISARPHMKRWLLRFDGVDDPGAVDALRGVDLEVDVPVESSTDDPDEFADIALVGLVARTDDGTALGVVREVEHLPMHDLLLVRTSDGRDVRVPFVTAIVPQVEVADGWLRVNLPPGLLDVEEP